MKTKFIFKLCLLILIAFNSTLKLKAQNPAWMNFTNGDVITDIAEYGNILYIATSGGLVKYNKVTTQTEFFNKANSGLPRNEISAMDIEANGNLWIITEAGISKYDGSNWILYDTTNSNLPNQFINDLAVEQNGVKWIASFYGLISFDGTSWAIYDTSNSNISSQATSKVFISPAGEKWIGTSDGLERFDGSNWILYDYSVAPFSFYNLTDMVFKNNDIFVATHGGFGQGEGLVKFDGNVWSSYTTVNSGLPYARVECLALDTSGNLWLGNFDASGYNSAIVKFDGTTWTVDSTGMLQYIKLLEIDESNRFFAGTESEGFSEYDGASFNRINTSNSGLSLSGGLELSIDDQQDVRATNDQGFTHFDRQVWTEYDTSNSSLLNCAVFGVIQDHTGNTWIGTNEGVVKYDGANWTRWDTSNSALTNEFVNGITVDRDNAIWIGTNFAPFKFDGTNWINYFSNAGSNINDVFVTDDGDVWMGSPGYGLNRFDRVSTWTNYTPLIGGNFQAGALDKNGNVWYGGNNLNKWDGTSWTLYTTADGLPWNFVTALAVDTNNILWIGTQLGLSKYDGTTFTNYLKQNSGLTGNYISDIEVDAFNNKWIGTGSGISVFNEDGVVLNIPGQENSQELNLRFYPNPATNSINLDLSNPIGKGMVLTIVDVIGNELQEFEITNNSTKIDVSKLESAVYFGLVTSEAGLISKGKFIIQ